MINLSELSQDVNNKKDDELIALVEAFRYFNRSSSTLHQAYSRLEEAAESLAKELEETNAALKDKNEELDHVNQYLKDILSSIGSGVIATDLEGRITIFNRTAEDMTGYTCEEVIGKNYHDFFMGELEENSPLLQTLMTGNSVTGLERELPVCNGDSIAVKSSSSWIASESGERLGVVETLEDLTQVRELERRMLHNKTLAALGEMAAQVAHELRNPLAGIKGFAGLLADDLKHDESSHRMVGRIIDGVNALDRIASNLLILTQDCPSDFERRPLEPVFKQAIELIEASSEGRFKIETDYPETPCPSKVDAGKLKQLILNLLTNACEACDGEGKAVLGYRVNPLTNELKITIRDFGPGIPEEIIEKVFNPFFTTKTQGTGLGLAIARKIAELHRGKIEAFFPNGSGTLITVTLPII